mgnify:CR=1 FL=1
MLVAYIPNGNDTDGSRHALTSSHEASMLNVSKLLEKTSTITKKRTYCLFAGKTKWGKKGSLGFSLW